MINIPFGDYKNFADCVSKNQNKDDPEAYCATIQKKAEGENFKRDSKGRQIIAENVPILFNCSIGVSNE